MNTIIDILKLRTPRLEYVSPPICGLIPSSASASGSIIVIEDSVFPPRTNPSAPSNPMITQPNPNATTGNCPLVSFSAPRGQLSFLIYEEIPFGSGNFSLSSGAIPPAFIGVLTPGSYFTAPVDINGVEGPHSGPTVVTGGNYTPVPIVTSPTAVSYNVYMGTTLIWSGVNPALDAFEGCSCTNFKVQAITLEGTALSSPVFACTPAAMTVSPSSITFSNIQLGNSQQQSFTLQNVGPVKITGTASLTLHDCTIITGANYTLLPGQTQTVTVQFAPTTPENLTGTITFSGANALSGTVNASSTCAAGTTLPALSLPGSFVETVLVIPGTRTAWVATNANNVTGQIVKVNLVNNTSFGSITPPGINGGSGGFFCDLIYNPAVGTQGGVIAQQLSGAGQRQLYDIGANSWGGLLNTPTPPGTICTTAVRPSDGMTLLIGEVGANNSRVLVTDKTLGTTLLALSPATTLGTCCWSSALNKFFLVDSSITGWLIDPNNLGAGLVATGPGSVIGGGRFLAEIPNGSGWIFASGISNWAIYNPVTQTILANSNFGPLNATGMVYSPCSGLIYVATVSGVLSVNLSTFATTNLGPGDAEHGIAYDLINNLKYVADVTTMQLLTYNY